MASTAVPTVQVDNGRVKVTRWDFAPGAETGWHRHEMDYVVTPIVDGEVRADLPDGSTNVIQMKAGVSYAREIGVEHNITNIGPTAFSFVEVELK